MTANTPAGNKECSLNTFERNAYFYGKLLTARDFQAEQKYFMDKDRTAHRLLHGSGIVCGLKVHEKDNQLEIDLGEGYALDCCGREIVVPQKTKVAMPGSPEGVYYLYLEFDEKAREPTPASDTVAATAEGGCADGRVCELYKLSVSQKPPLPQRTLLIEEGGVTYWYLFSLGPDSVDTYISTLDGTLNPGTKLSETLLGQRFADHGYGFTSGAKPEVEKDGSSWKIVDGYKYFVRKEDETLGVYSFCPPRKCPECSDAKVFLAAIEIRNGAASINESETCQFRSVVYSNPLLRDLLDGHLEDSENPHHTTARQVGALVSVEGVKNPGGNIDLIEGGAIQIIADNSTNTITISENHSTRIDNPHGTTAAQVGALVSVEGVEGNPKGNLSLTSSDGSIQVKPNPDNHSINLTIARLSEKWPVITAINWENNQPMPRARFNDGLEITFSERMHPSTVTLDTFIVTIELPEDQDIVGLPGHLPLIVHGAIKHDGDTTWRFTPRPKITSDVLTKWIIAEKKLSPSELDGISLRCRVVLKGNAILDEEGERPLDGDVFAVITRDGEMPFSRLVLPSGDGHIGGDFESWFYLTPDQSDKEPGHETDFTRIKGIGPAFDQRLKDAGVLTFADLATQTPEHISGILGWSKERVVKDELIEQARQLAQEG
jgi:hypothetical protein